MSKLLAHGCVSADFLAGLLAVSPALLTEYVDGRKAVPLNRQAQLARYVITHQQEFEREGRRLRSQIAAAIAYETHQTATHVDAPATLRWRRA